MGHNATLEESMSRTRHLAGFALFVLAAGCSEEPSRDPSQDDLFAYNSLDQLCAKLEGLCTGRARTACCASLPLCAEQLDPSVACAAVTTRCSRRLTRSDALCNDMACRVARLRCSRSPNPDAGVRRDASSPEAAVIADGPRSPDARLASDTVPPDRAKPDVTQPDTTAPSPDAAPPASKTFLTGWWIDVNRPEKLAGFAAEGNTLVLGSSAIWFVVTQSYVVQQFLDEANKHGIKVILGLNYGGSPYNMPPADFTNAISKFKGHPALFGWYVADEPEIQSNAAALHGYLATSPGYYALAKAADPNHPVFISFNLAYDAAGWTKIRGWYDVLDMIGMHSYPYWSVNPQAFGGGEGRTQYDTWKQLLQDAAAYGKPAPIATCQGFGDNTMYPYRTPTYKELRYQTFAAVVQGIDKVLFWMYNGWGDKDPVALDRVKQMTLQIQSIGAEMNAGLTQDPKVGVSQPATNLVYRYGVSAGRHVILAVNIANRTSAQGASLSSVKLTLPAGATPSQVNVLHESRTIPVTSGAFTDSFAPFEVHMYQW
jgi:hypothetical protein